MSVIGDTASYTPKTNSAWSGFTDIQITQVVETTFSSMETGRQAPKTLPCQSEELHPDFSNGPWTLVRFFTDEILPDGFELDQVLQNSGVTINMVSHIAKHKDPGSYELVVATPYLDLLQERFPNFKLIVDYNPLESAEEDIRIHGTWEAKKRVRINTINTAVEAIRNGWGYGSADCYQKVIRKAGFGTELERAILNWDILHSDPRILEYFTQNLLFLSLNCCDRYDTSSALEILERDQNEWLQPFRNGHTELSELFMAADLPNGIREGLEQQTISLVRSLLEYSGGKVDCRQHDFGIDYTTSQNASLCASLLGVSCSSQFGRFDPEEMQGALSRSQLFAELSKPCPPDTLEWSHRMMVSVPIGFQDNYLNLPSQLLCGFGARQVNQIRIQVEHTYHRLPCLRKEENNILVLLTLSSTYHGQTLQVLNEWIKSEESSDLYQRLIKDLRLPQTQEGFALTLAALLCRERLLPYAVDDSSQPIRGSYLADFDAILNAQESNNRRTVFEQIIVALMRVLYSLNTSEETVRFLNEVLDKTQSVLEPLDGVMDQYCARKVEDYDHDQAFEGAMEGLSKRLEALARKDRNEGEWVLLSASPSGPRSMNDGEFSF